MEPEVFSCPLNHKCEDLKGTKFTRCKWYIKVTGKAPQSEKLIDEWGCAISWLPILLIENAQTNRGQTQALESFRNEMVKGQTQFNSIIYKAAKGKYIK